MVTIDKGYGDPSHNVEGTDSDRAAGKLSPYLDRLDEIESLIDELKRKDFISIENFSQTKACSAGFIDLVAESFEVAAPLMKFLTEAVGQPF